MLDQMMSRLRTEVAQHDLGAVHFEDPVANAAVSALLAADAGLTRVRLTEFVRDVAELHTAADAADETQCLKLMAKLEAEFAQLQAAASPESLRAAEELANRYTCPMHPNVRGARDAACPKCGMSLDQQVVLLPSQAGGGSLPEQSAVVATVEPDGPLAVGKRTLAVLHLRRPGGEPVGLSDLIETHTKKIHLLIVDKSLADYHHEHPRLTETPGDYVFHFTPRKPGPYLLWADLRPLSLGLQEYDQVVIKAPTQPAPITHRETKLTAEVEGLHFESVMVFKKFLPS